jgi:hypothetical protein
MNLSKMCADTAKSLRIVTMLPTSSAVECFERQERIRSVESKYALPLFSLHLLHHLEHNRLVIRAVQKRKSRQLWDNGNGDRSIRRLRL